jgi:hypothetical protein
MKCFCSSRSENTEIEESSKGLPSVMDNPKVNTALCAAIKPREIFESAAKRHFQKFLRTP